jgi:1A family penicillin-binding protein
MYRQGKYTRQLSPWQKTKRFVRRRIDWFMALKWWQKALVVFGPIAAVLIVIPVLTYLYYYNDIGNVERLMNRNSTGVVLLDKNGKEFFSRGKAAHRDIVRLEQISDDLEHALVASEDKDFYNHSGFSPLSIVRAMYTNILARGVTGGGSTITQQLAKNTLLSDQRSFMRKYQELTIAMAIENRYSKKEIMEMYLNSVFYGDNSYGIAEAAKNYYGKTPAQLNLAESAMLIGVLPAPTAYSPVTGDPALAKQRQTTVLSRMVKNGFISEEQKKAALNEQLAYAPRKSPIDNQAPHFTEKILAELYDKYGEEQVERSGYRVKTTLDLGLQDAANQAVQNGRAYLVKRGGSNASLVAVDPKNGNILAYVGSADYNDPTWGKVDMVKTPRQPGSSFKPIYFADALASGKITPATMIEDKKITDLGGFSPQNASRSYYGNVSVRQALGWSLNIPAVRVMQKEGIDNAVTAAKNLGITSLKNPQSYGLSLALGSAEVPLMQMTHAYAGFANGGNQVDLADIASIENKYGQPIFTSSKKSHQAISQAGAYLISNILSDTQAKSRIFGNSLTVYGTDGKQKNVAVKTGTTDEARDAWTIGYTTDIAVGVWTGNNDNSPMRSGGSDMAGPIFKAMMKQAIGSNNPQFAQPATVVKATVCSGEGTTTDVFLATAVPKQCGEKKEEPKEEAPVEAKKCTITGKEALLATDPNCKEEMCMTAGQEDLAANDPKCNDTKQNVKDTDKDGVADALDQCPNTPTGSTVNSVGCAAGETPSPTTTTPVRANNGNGNNR